MNGESLNVLMVEDDIDFVELTRLSLVHESVWHIDITHAVSLQDALKLTLSTNFSAILLDLKLPDSSGIDTFTQIRLNAPNVPIVVLSANCDYWVAIQSVREGAQDYLLKGEITGALLARSLYYAVERNHTIETLRRLSLLDSLTNLYNRRGFTTLAEQHLELSRRNPCDMFLLIGDVDYLKNINDNFSHACGDDALVRTANVFRKTFRRSDIIGRLGGDEFTVLAIDVPQDGLPVILHRFYEILAEDNQAHASDPYTLSVSLGSTYLDRSKSKSIDEWISDADRVLYEQKRKRH